MHSVQRGTPVQAEVAPAPHLLAQLRVICQHQLREQACNLVGRRPAGRCSTRSTHRRTWLAQRPAIAAVTACLFRCCIQHSTQAHLRLGSPARWWPNVCTASATCASDQSCVGRTPGWLKLASASSMRASSRPTERSSAGDCNEACVQAPVMTDACKQHAACCRCCMAALAAC